MARRNHEVLRSIKVGDTITADFLNRIAAAINRNTQAVAAPTQKIETGGAGDSPPATSSWSAGASDITDQTVQVTDSNGDTHDIERITVIVFTNDDTGDTMTLNIAYT